MVQIINTIGMSFINAKKLLGQEGFQVASETETQLDAYLELIKQWNPITSLVSANDLPFIKDTHLVDALSLVGVISSFLDGPTTLIDIGSGGGFPAIPIAIMLPELQLTLIERNAKKAGFLQKISGALRLNHVTILHGAYPHELRAPHPRLITARAVEKPEKVIKEILLHMPKDAIFISQLKGTPVHVPEMFHVEHIDDVWSREGLRRGALYVVRRLTSG